MREERQQEQQEQGSRMEAMGEHAHGRQRQQRGWPGQPAPSLQGARATPAQPASGGGCLPQPRWAVCATGAGAHQGQTSREGEKDIWWTVVCTSVCTTPCKCCDYDPLPCWSSRENLVIPPNLLQPGSRLRGLCRCFGMKSAFWGIQRAPRITKNHPDSTKKLQRPSKGH